MAALTVSSTPASPSLLRLIWSGTRRQPALILMGLVPILVWVFWLSEAAHISLAMKRSHPLADLAFSLQMLSWLTASLLFHASRVMPAASQSSLTQPSPNRDRLRRFMRSPIAIFLDLSGSAPERAIAKLGLGEPAAPDVAVVAMPLLTALGSACLGFSVSMALAELLAGSPPPALPNPRSWATFWTIMLVLFLLTGLHNLGRESMRVRRWGAERARVAAEAAAALHLANLQTLQAQMNPDFLFGALHTVASLATTEQERAERAVEHLAIVLRHALQRGDRECTSIEDEVQFVREYLAVEHDRLGSRLRVTWDIPDDTGSLRVPTMSVQMLVEQAIARAAESQLADTDIHVAATRFGDGRLVRMAVDAGGPGVMTFDLKTPRLTSLRERLHNEFGTRQALGAEKLPMGARISFAIPAVVFDPALLSNKEASNG